jgi:hypothetical protein
MSVTSSTIRRHTHTKELLKYEDMDLSKFEEFAKFLEYINTIDIPDPAMVEALQL